MGRSRKKHELSGAFLALPMRGVLEPGGLLDRLSPEAFKLFILSLTLADRTSGDGLRGGGVKGPRFLPYRLAAARLGLHPRKVCAAFKELVATGVLEVAEPGAWQAGIRAPNVYEIGPAHPWSPKPHPTSNPGFPTESRAGPRTGAAPMNRSPQVDSRLNNDKSSCGQRVTPGTTPDGVELVRSPGLDARSRSAIGADPIGADSPGHSNPASGAADGAESGGRAADAPAGSAPAREPGAERQRRKTAALANLHVAREVRK